jgi:hypothetical protein
MKISKKYKSLNLSLLTMGMVYIFLFLFLNVSFSSVYKLLLKDSSITAFIDSDLEKNDSENEAEDSKKVSEISKEYFLGDVDFLFVLQVEKGNQYFHHVSDLLSHYPEKDSPPPKITT